MTSLDLSHNKIADRGVKAIARLLDDRCVVISLNLSDNHVHADGGKYFGRALKLNVSLQNLNLRLNRLGDEVCVPSPPAFFPCRLHLPPIFPSPDRTFRGAMRRHMVVYFWHTQGCKLLLEGLQENSTLAQLNLSCNAFEAEAAQALTQVVRTCKQARVSPRPPRRTAAPPLASTRIFAAAGFADAALAAASGQRLIHTLPPPPPPPRNKSASAAPPRAYSAPLPFMARAWG